MMAADPCGDTALAASDTSAAIEAWRARRAMRAAGSASWEFDGRTRSLTADAALWRFLGLPPTSAARSVGEVMGAVAPADRSALRSAVRAALGTGDAVSCVVRVDGPPGAERWLRLAGRRWRAPGGGWRIVGLCSDVTHDEHRSAATELTLQELDHRVKNIFAVALGLIAMTARTAATPGEMADALAGRLSALARAHALLRPPQGSDRARMAPPTLAHIVDAVVEPLLPVGQRRVMAAGPIVAIAPRAVTPVAMLLQELATNALKHGALASPEGRLTIRWRIEGERLQLDWREEGVTLAAGHVPQVGFGSKLIDAIVRNQLQGGMVQTASTDGLALALDLPLASLTSGSR